MASDGEQVQTPLSETLAETCRLMTRHSELAQELRQLLTRAPGPPARPAEKPQPKPTRTDRRRRSPVRVRNDRALHRPPPPVPFGLLVNFEEAELLELVRQLDPQQRAMLERLLVTLTSQPEPPPSDPGSELL